jgi:hypothetical protein
MRGGAVYIGTQRVEHAHHVAVGQGGVDNRGADESSAAGDEHAFTGHATCRREWPAQLAWPAQFAWPAQLKPLARLARPEVLTRPV